MAKKAPTAIAYTWTVSKIMLSKYSAVRRVEFSAAPLSWANLGRDPSMDFGQTTKNGFTKNSFAKNSFTKNSFAKNSFAKNSFAKNSFAKNSFAKNSLSAQPLSE